MQHLCGVMVSDMAKASFIYLFAGLFEADLPVADLLPNSATWKLPCGEFW